MAYFSPAFYPSEDLRAFKSSQKPPKGMFAHDDLYFGSNPFRPTASRDFSTPLFDIRETKDAYFLEGEFPGIPDQKAIKLEWKGKRTLVVEAAIPKLDLEAEWDIKLPKSPTPTDPKSRTNSVGTPLEGALAELKVEANQNNHNESAIESPGPSRAASRATSPNRGHLGVPHKEKKHRSSSFFSIKSEKPEKKHKEHHTSAYHDWSSERHTGVYKRTFCFPDDILADTLQARLNQGLLKMMIKKAEPTKATAVQIQFGE